ncbi:conserved hypothetical protein [Talaromyces stipitatus ATCC 10500]|uniref:DUF1772-domain-containing protein n=1 Tax=Talaromyces stipitatus (strain ATCC 10500 / CBS 375.48 / QM 6759 / NRRL 1006) TaxID=441959 RepID=B8MQB9_TALSN|nr:uncharacterized protein TSTA_058100 [Talaromyces stipitatus ATCC 10500]EED13321.1 conserved hypothetical protein [Talaromyces stipitatus ATCC 10500]
MSTISIQATAVVTGSFLSGAMMSLSLFAVPVLLDTTTEAPQLFFQWVRMYHYGHMALPTMAVGTFLLYSYAAVKKRSSKQPWRRFLIAGITTLTMVPFTWFVMVPTNNELFRLQRISLADPTVMPISEATELVTKWSWMHLTRSFIPLAGAVMGAMWTFAE